MILLGGVLFSSKCITVLDRLVICQKESSLELAMLVLIIGVPFRMRGNIGPSLSLKVERQTTLAIVLEKGFIGGFCLTTPLSIVKTRLYTIKFIIIKLSLHMNINK